MMATLSDRVKLAAQGLIAAAGMAQAVAATDIQSQAATLYDQYTGHSEVQLNRIKQDIADEIRKRHKPGISGSV
ncbi:hypothetical protein FCK90_15105 [Kocuria coralli]|uniref:Uncharacterized protein n=1 Tax=Kocuria coralli TaxID=1461025 RepID=A0A5J5KTH3_9MICC|nr:hypothetical protein [Kocuria coralli]KAA9392884.1 hypothetical protein FCK90_15105 [Kocuria coralli]